MPNGTIKMICFMLVLVPLAGCFGKAGKKKFRATDNRSSFTQKAAHRPAAGPLTLRDIQARVGIRNFHQIYQTMINATGIPGSTIVVAGPPEKRISTIYRELKSQLPPGNDIKGFNAANQLAIAKLAGAFCEAFIGNDSARSSISGFNFDLPPATAFNDQNRKLIVRGMTDKFWGKGARHAPPLERTDQIVKGLANDLMASKAGLTTIEISKGVCMAILSASPVTML